jgi:predicted CopG family antitoxin
MAKSRYKTIALKRDTYLELEKLKYELRRKGLWVYSFDELISILLEHFKKKHHSSL